MRGESESRWAGHALLVLFATAGLIFAGATSATAAPFSLGADGKSEPIYEYEDAIRERVMVPQPGIDQDADGEPDEIAVDIIRPAGTGPDLQVPAIIMPSPYFTTTCRGLEGECMEDKDGDGVNDIWPMFYDNYFLPRGYAYILAQANGTGHSTGCPLHGGPGDVAGMRSVIDWLNGRAAGETPTGSPVLASWHNGSSAMIGKSYDGTFANGVAATGVEGLKTIVPITAISAWYDYSRTGGIRHNTNYPSGLSNTVTNPNRRSLCASAYSWLNATDGDETGDYNDFWQDRNHNKDVANVKAAVFAIQGFQDDNVRMNHMSNWWRGLTENDVPRKLWLLRSGHTDPFDSRRAEWVDTLHLWFDHYLLGVDNGIEEEPMVTIEEEKDVWADYADWPIPGTKTVDAYLRAAGVDEPGTFGGGPGGGTSDSLSFTGASLNETNYINAPDTARNGRLVFLSKPLTEDLRLSGEAVLNLRASLSTAQSNLAAILVDYGDGTQVTRSNNGTSLTSEETCWGDPGEYDINCYREVTKPTTNVSQWRVARGILDSSNRDSLWDEAPVTPGQFYSFHIPVLATEHLFEEGHRVGVVVGTNGLFGINGTAGATVTVDTRLSSVSLPLLGGYRAAVTAGLTDPETVLPILADMPGDIEVDNEDPDGQPVAYDLPTATDNEDPEPVVACDPPPGSVFPPGVTTVTCQATDANGNVASATFEVTMGGLPPEPEPEPEPTDDDPPRSEEPPPAAKPSDSKPQPPRANRRPQARLTASPLASRNLSAQPKKRFAPQRYRLDARGSHDPDGRIASYRWLAGGQVVARGRVAELTVTRATRVTLVVTDNRGARASRRALLKPRARGQRTISRTLTYCNGCARPRGAQAEKLADLRRLVPRTLRLKIEGHTAGPGPVAENHVFARTRARLVARALLGGLASPPPLQIRSYGDTRPVADNATAAGQAQNRRVVIRLTLRDR